MVGNEVSRDFRVLDDGAMIIGAAIAASHMRLAHPQPHGWAAWVLVITLFAWLALTATGPFLYLTRRFVARISPDYPRIGDQLWVLWGVPWVASALVDSALRPRSPDVGRLDPVYVGSLGLGLFLATMIAVPILAARYLWGDPAASFRGEPAGWTQWVGLALTTTWPIQCGIGLVLMG